MPFVANAVPPAPPGEASLEAGEQARLTLRERETLELLLAGLPTKEVAARLGLSPNTAAQHIKALYRRFGVRSRVALIGLLLEADRAAPSPDAAVALAPRERQALDLLLAGLSARQIADRLGIGVHSANRLTKAIFRRFGVGSRAALMALRLRKVRFASPILGP